VDMGSQQPATASGWVSGAACKGGEDYGLLIMVDTNSSNKHTLL
jgi:hypothetical protein